MTNRIPEDERWRRELSELLTRIETINRPLTRPLSPSEGAGTGTANEISPVARPHGQALNLNPNRNLARLRFLEIKSKITIKIGKKPFRLNSMREGASSWRGSRCGALALSLALLLSGCATSRPGTAGSRHFVFERDTFAYANELVWEYHFDERGKWVHQRREPNPDYTHHCFVVARATKQLYQNARFDPAQPKADTQTYRRLIRKVVSTSPRNELPDTKKVVIPGYANLRELSQAQEKLLKANCGGAWRSYFQRGHWRMIWAFTRHHQQKTAEALAAEIRSNRAPVVHVVRFPSLSINHAVVLFDVAENEKEILFAAYDPNLPEK